MTIEGIVAPAAIAASRPTVTAVTPTTGPPTGGTSVTVNGTAFTGTTAVKFGAVPAASYTIVSDSQIVAISPAQPAAAHNILITTPGGTSTAVTADVFTYTTPRPTVTAVTPTTGPPTGGTSVTVNGTAFTGTTAVKFGAVPAASYTIVSDSQIVAISPAQPAAAHNILITTPGGTSTAVTADVFTYTTPRPTVTAVTPTTGPPTGGTSVTVNGTAFTGTTAVKFGAVPAASYTIVSDSQIVAISPAQPAAAHNILITTPGGTSTAVTADVFTYVDSSWSGIGYDPQNTHDNQNEGTLTKTNISRLSSKWQVGPSGGAWAASQPAVSSGIAYFGLPSDGVLYAVHVSDGSAVWSYATGGSIQSSPTVWNGAVYVGSYDDSVYSLNAATGALKWKYATGSTVSGSPIISNGILYIPSKDGNLYALNATTGHLIWKDAETPSMTNPAASNGLVFVSDQGTLLALSATTGALVWSHGVGGGFDYSTPTVAYGLVYVWGMEGSANGAIQAFAATTGTPTWQDNGSWFSLDLAVGNGMVYASYNGNLEAMDAYTGVIQWGSASAWEPDNAPGGLGIANGMIFYIDSNNLLAAADTANGQQLWEEPSTGPQPTVGITIAAASILFPSADGNEHSIQLLAP